METIINGLIWYLVFLISTTCHEAAHALVSYVGGDDTAYNSGQVSLDPLPHIKREPFGMLVIPIIFFISTNFMLGWASTPYDPQWADKYHRRAALMALAGPMANFLIASFAGILIYFGLQYGYLKPNTLQGFELVLANDPSWSGFATTLNVAFILNLILFVFNLLPVPPLDGSSIITIFMSKGMFRQYQKFIAQPMIALAGFFLAYYFFIDIFRPVYRFAVEVLIH